MSPTPVFRPSARLIVRDPRDRILLFSTTYADGTYWFTPGGGVKRGETPAGAAVRELAEETGYVLAESDAGPVVATSAGQWPGHDGTRFFGADSFFFVTVGDAPVRTDGQEDLERSLITGHRWWTAGELLDASDEIWPPGLPDLVTQLLTSGAPDWPVRLPWRSFLRFPSGNQESSPVREPGSSGGCRQGTRVERRVPSGAARKTGAAGPMSRTASRSPGSGSASLTSAAASRPSAPLDTAIATASRSADSCSDGRATVAAV